MRIKLLHKNILMLRGEEVKMAALNRKHRSDFAAVLAIQVNNKMLGPEIIRRVQSVTVKLYRKKAATLNLQLKDDTYAIFDNDIFGLSSRIVIYCGWPDEVVRKGPFRVTGYTPVYPENAAPTLTVEAKDISATEMKNKSRSRSWSGNSVKQVIQKIAKEHKLKAVIDIDPSDNIIFNDENALTQSAEDNGLFLGKLSKRTGHIWGVEEGILYYNREEKVKGKPGTLDYKMGARSLKQFSPEFKIYSPSTGGKGKTHTKLILGNIDFTSDTATFLEDLSLLQVYDGNGMLGRSLTYNEAKSLAVIDGAGSSRYDPNHHDANINDAGSLFYSRGDPIDVTNAVLLSDTAEAAFGVSDFLAGEDVSPRARALIEDYSPKQDRFKEQNAIQKLKGNTANVVSSVASVVFDSDTASVITSAMAKDDVPIHALKAGEGGELGGNGVALEGGTPMTELGIKKMGRSIRRSAVEKAKMIPTIPSWLWNPHETVYVRGVHKKAEGLYEIHEVTLSFNKDKGISTELNGKKRTFGRRVKKGPRSLSLVENQDVDVDQPLAEQVDDNPRPPLREAEENVNVIFYGDEIRSDGSGKRGVVLKEGRLELGNVELGIHSPMRQGDTLFFH